MSISTEKVPRQGKIPSKYKLPIIMQPDMSCVVIDNTVHNLKSIIHRIPPFDFFSGKPTYNLLYYWLSGDEIGEWLYNHYINDITVEVVQRYGTFKSEVYVKGFVFEKDYTFYALKWGQ